VIGRGYSPECTVRSPITYSASDSRLRHCRTSAARRCPLALADREDRHLPSLATAAAACDVQLIKSMRLPISRRALAPRNGCDAHRFRRATLHMFGGHVVRGADARGGKCQPPALPLPAATSPQPS